MSSTLVPLIGPIPGGMEMVVILLIAVLLFGANKIPKLARSSGQAIGEFQKGREEVEQELKEIQSGDSTESEPADESVFDDEGLEDADAVDESDSLETDANLDAESEER